MSNNHVNQTIMEHLRPWVPKSAFAVSVQTAKGERGFRMEAADAMEASKIGIPRLNIRDEEIPAFGLCLRVEPTK